MNTCPECAGEGKFHGLGRPGYRYMILDCPLCAGTGELTEDQFARYRSGKLFRRFRLKLGLGLQACADQLGISTSELSNLERGIEDNKVLEEWKTKIKPPQPE